MGTVGVYSLSTCSCFNVESIKYPYVGAFAIRLICGCKIGTIPHYIIYLPPMQLSGDYIVYRTYCKHLYVYIH